MPAVLVVTTPSGMHTRVRVDHIPFRIGRLSDNDLVLRDGRASRHHARIVAEDDGFAVEDLDSSYGVFVNGRRVKRARLNDGDCIEFGFADSYRAVFKLGADEPPTETALAGGANLSKLRATLEVARALQASMSTDDVLTAVVEAALTVTGCERGFLLLLEGDDLAIRLARSRGGPLAPNDLRVPTRMLMRALKQRREFLSMNFDPAAGEPGERTITDLELRSVVCVPLVRIRAGSSPQETATLHPEQDTVGLLYMDSRLRAADLSAGSRELLTTLALEASTVLENARLLEELWARQRMEQELRIAREIQISLLPRALPDAGWFRAAGSSVPSSQVGGDYFDVRPVGPAAWTTVVADVSGKGVGAALLAALLQGMFLAAPYTRLPLEEMFSRANRFLNERTGGEQYATIFYCTTGRDGGARWVNAGHPPALLARAGGKLEALPATGVPLGLLEETPYPVHEIRFRSGDKLVIYSDGLTEARNPAGEFFGMKRLRDAVCVAAQGSCREVHDSVRAAVDAFTAGAEQRDDITIAVFEYRPE